MTNATYPEPVALDNNVELRILSGTQAGAHSPISHGNYIGTALDCDFILAESSVDLESSEILLYEDEWCIGHLPKNPLNHPILFGTVWLTVARTNQPWIDAPGQRLTRSSEDGSASAEGEDEQISLPMQTHTPASEEGSIDRPYLTKLLHLSRQYGAVRTLPFAILICLLIAVTIYLLPHLTSSSNVPTQEHKTTGQDEMANTALQKINDTLSALGMSDRLIATLQPAGAILISGWVRTTAERDKLALAMSRILPMPSLSIQIEEEVIQRIGITLAKHPIRYIARYMTGGKIKLEGIASDYADIYRLDLELKEQFPDVIFDSSTIMLAENVSKSLEEKLRAAGFMPLLLTWQDASLMVTVSLRNRAEQATLQTLFTEFNQEHWDIAKLSTLETAGSDLPFGIRTIVSGSQPYIVLVNGQKILIGGSHSGYHLDAIEQRRIILSADDQVVIQR